MSRHNIELVKKMAQMSHDDFFYRDIMFDAMRGEDKEKAYLAAWAFTHTPASDNDYLSVHRKEITDIVLTNKDKNSSLTRLALTLLCRLDWEWVEIDVELLDYCMACVRSKEACGIRSLCVKLAYKMCRHHNALMKELLTTINMVLADEQKTSVKSSCQWVLKKVEAEKNNSKSR